MAGPISIEAIRRITSRERPSWDSAAHGRRDFGGNVDEDGEGTSDEDGGIAETDDEDDEMRDMRRADAEYRRQLRIQAHNLSRRQSRASENGPDYTSQRAESPAEMDEEANGEPTEADRKASRNVTITEPVRTSAEQEDSSLGDKDKDQQYLQPAPRRKKRLRRWSTSVSMTKTNTLSSIASWMDRENAQGQKRFIGRVWDFVFGKKEEVEEPREGDPDYVPPKYRWTPILSGLLQPFSILLEIPGLTEHWYVKQVDNVPVAYQENPIILDVGLAISMFCAVVANIALISRFLERRVLTSTITTIVGLTIHDCINIAAVTAFGVIHSVNDGFDYSEAFWLCICSTVASVFTNCTLVYDLIKTKDFRRSGSGLTPKQRKLVIIVMILLVYIALGALCFNFLLPDIPFQNALYYTVVTIETIGFGDILPTTLGAKIFLFFYAPIGILNLALAVTTARDTLVESWSSAYRRRRHEVLRRHKERKQQRMEEDARRKAIENKLKQVGAPVYLETAAVGLRSAVHVRRLNVRALTKDQLHEAEHTALMEIANAQGSSSSGSRHMSIQIAVAEHKDGGYEKAVEDVRRLQEELNQQSLTSEEGYKEFQEKMASEEKRENWIKFGFAFGLFLTFWVVGATIFSRTEGWSWFEGFYFCFVTFTTIGYGDYYPTSPAGRATFIIWALFGVATVTLLIAVLSEGYSNKYKRVVFRKGQKRAMTVMKANREKAILAREQSGEIDKRKMERLPYEIIDLMQTWHSHINAVRHGALEQNDDDKLKTLLHEIMDEQRLSDIEKRELMGDAETRKMLFWNGYERAVHRLVVVAEHAVHHHEKMQRQIAYLTALSSPTSSNSYLDGSSLARTPAHSPYTPYRKPSWLDPLTIDIEKGGRKLETVHEGAWTSDPQVFQVSPEDDKKSIISERPETFEMGEVVRKAMSRRSSR